MSDHEKLNELKEAASRASYIVTEEIEALLERAEREAEAIRRDAERYAEYTRRNAVASAERLLGRLQALEFPLGQLVVGIRDEVDLVSKELESGPSVDGDSTEIPAVAESAAVDGEDTSDRASAWPTDERPQAAEGPQAREQEPAYPPDESIDVQVSEPQPRHPGRPKRAPRAPAGRKPQQEGRSFDFDVAQREPGPQAGRRVRRKTKRPKGNEPFIDMEGSCAICQRTFRAGSEAELARSGWKVSGDVGLCPECQADRWQLPEGARLPFRRGAS